MIALVLTLFAMPALAEESPTSWTCNRVGIDDIRPGETPVAHHRRLERNQLYWKNLADVSRAHGLDKSQGQQETLNTYKLFETNCAEKRAEVAANTNFEYWEASISGGISGGRITLGELLKKKGGAAVGFASGNRAFASDEAFERWLIPQQRHDELDVRALYGASKSPDLQTCFGEPYKEEKARIRPHLDITLCNDHIALDRYTTADVGYKVSRANGIFTVDHSISLAYSGDSKLKKEVLARVLRNQYCVEKFYANQGIRLRLHFRTDQNSPDYTKSDNTVVCVPEGGGTDEGKWEVMKYYGKLALDDEHLCSSMAHEIGHQLRLEDRYPGGCPAANDPAVPYSNIMRSGAWEPIKNSTLESWQARRIVAPVCEHVPVASY